MSLNPSAAVIVANAFCLFVCLFVFQQQQGGQGYLLNAKHFFFFFLITQKLVLCFCCKPNIFLPAAMPRRSLAPVSSSSFKAKNLNVLIFIFFISRQHCGTLPLSISPSVCLSHLDPPFSSLRRHADFSTSFVLFLFLTHPP